MFPVSLRFSFFLQTVFLSCGVLRSTSMSAVDGLVLQVEGTEGDDPNAVAKRAAGAWRSLLKFCKAILVIDVKRSVLS